MTLSLTGAASSYDQGGDTPWLYVVARTVNGVPCQATFGEDQQVAGNDNTTVLFGGYSQEVSDGSFSYTASFTPPSVGPYTICAWLESDDDDGSNSGDTAAQVVTASSSSSYTAVNDDRLAISGANRTRRRGRPFTLAFNGETSPYDNSGDTPWLYALIRRSNGKGCEPTFGQDQQVAGNDDTTVLFGSYGQVAQDGTFSYTAAYTPTAAGTYTVCAWLESDDEDSSNSGDTAAQVVTASASSSFTVPGSPAACIVPGARNLTLRTAEARLVKAHCRVGRIRRRRSSRIRRGHVVRLSARAGARKPRNAKIAITVSRGRR